MAQNPANERDHGHCRSNSFSQLLKEWECLLTLSIAGLSTEPDEEGMRGDLLGQSIHLSFSQDEVRSALGVSDPKYDKPWRDFLVNIILSKATPP